MKPRPRYKGRPRPMDLRTNIQRQRLARFLMLGMNAEQIARRMNRKPQTIRYAIAQPELLALVEELQREELKRADRKIRGLLLGAIKALKKQLRSHDWRARDAAIEKVLRVHGRFLDRIDVSGEMDVRHQHQLGTIAMDDMTSEQRRLTRELLTSMRKSLPARASKLTTAPGETSRLTTAPVIDITPARAITQ